MKHLRILTASLGALLLLATACSTDDHASGTRTSQTSDAGPKAANAMADKPTEKPAAKAEVGKAAPEFTLKDLDGKEHKLSQYKDKIVVLEWFSPGCPMCKWAYGTGPLAEMPEKMKKDGVVWLSINSEAPDRADSTAKNNKEFVEKYGLKAPILFDPTGEVGRAYGAKTTPHMYVIDAKGKLVYMGALDNAPLGKVRGEGERIDYVGDAVTAAKAGKPVKEAETKAYG